MVPQWSSPKKGTEVTPLLEHSQVQIETECISSSFSKGSLSFPHVLFVVGFLIYFFFLPGVVSLNFFPPISKEKKVSCRP